MSKIKDYYNKYRSEVIVSLITAFICFLLKNIYVYLKDTGAKFIDVFGNFIYYEMGRIDDLAITEYVLSVSLGILISLFILIYVPFLFIGHQKGNESKSKNSRSLFKNSKIKVFIGIVGFIDLIFLVAYPLGIMYCLDKKHDFDLKMTALKPYITEEKYDLLYSEWVRMYGKKDYRHIQKELFKLKCEYVIKDEEIKNSICK